MRNDLLIAINYYFPYISGLSNVARDIAEGLAARGKKVTVVASQHDSRLPNEETLNGVRIIRAPVDFHIGKGVVSLSFINKVCRESKKSKVLNIHAPMLEAGILAFLSKAPVVLTYQCDVSLAPTLIGRLQNKTIDWSTRLSANYARFVTVSSDDYADNSRVKDAFNGKRVVVPPPCHIRNGGKELFRDSPGIHIGFLGRIVEEKGIEYLVDGFRALKDKDARLLLAGDYSGIAGGSVIERVRRRISGDLRIKVLGFLSEEDVAHFYASLDILALPSVNPFEAFGIVQVEAIMQGIPVIASNLPGVRQPVLLTGMGTIVKPRSAVSITFAIEKLKQDIVDVKKGTAIARSLFGFDNSIKKFEELFHFVAPDYILNTR